VGELYERFLEAWDAPVRGRGDLDDKLGALHGCAEQATGEDREQLEGFLLPRLEGGDGIAGGLLARMRSARALERILELARAERHWTASIDLMIGLAAYRGDERVAEVLRSQLAHVDFLVRHHAAASLLAVVGLRADRWDDDLGRLAQLLQADLPALRARGLALLDQAVRRREAGEPLGELAADWRPPDEEHSEALRRLVAALQEPAASFAPADLAALGSAEEEFFVTILVMRLAGEGERRSADALAVLGREGSLAALARQALEEAAASSNLQVAAAARAALADR